MRHAIATFLATALAATPVSAVSANTPGGEEVFSVGALSSTAPPAAHQKVSRPEDSRRDYFRYPDAALVRSLGDIAPGVCLNEGAVCDGKKAEATDAITGGWPLAVPGLGVPLGGVGAGAFMINQSGTFGPWNFGGQQGSSWEPRALPQAAFHIRERIGTGPAVTRTLAADGPTREGSLGPVPERSWESPLPAWNELKQGDADYATLYPFGWMSYKPFKTDVSMRFFSPMVAGEDRRTSLPVAYFDVRIANHTDSTADMAVMFTMPNVAGHMEGDRADPSVPQGPPTVRKDLSSRHARTGGIEFITLSSNGRKNTADAHRSEWTLATPTRAGQQITHTTSWDAGGSGADVYRPFEQTGRLPNTALAKGSTAGALSVSARLAPGEVRTIPFTLAWDFPQVGFAENRTVWMRRYTNYYGSRTDKFNEYVKGSYPFNQSLEIARDAVRGRDAALRAVRRWWDPIATERAYPRRLRTAALNQLSMLTFNNSFWEGGLVKNEMPPMGFDGPGPGQHVAARRDAHLFAVQDTGAGGQSGMARTTDIQVYGYRGGFKLFSNLYQGTLLASAEAAEIMPNKNAPDLYMFTESEAPFIQFGNDLDEPIQPGTDSRMPVPGVTQWGDSPSKFAFEWFAHAKMTGNKEFLREVWPAIQLEIQFLRALRPPGTHLPLDSGQFANIYNGFPQPAFGVYNSQLSLLAFSAAIAAGEMIKADETYLDDLRADLEQARFEFETLFWDPVNQYYKFGTAGPLANQLFIDTFFADNMATSMGLEPLVDPNRHRLHWQNHASKLLSKDGEGRLSGAANFGAVDAESGSGTVNTGSAYAGASDIYRTGVRAGDPELRRLAIKMGLGVANQSYYVDTNGFAFNVPNFYNGGNPESYTYPAYSQVMAVWDLMDAIKPLRFAR